jgi:hypothetical protein
MSNNCNLCGLREDSVDLLRKNKTWCLVHDKEVDNKLSGCEHWRPTTPAIKNQKVHIANEIKKSSKFQISKDNKKETRMKDNDAWSEIEKDYDLSKRAFGRKIKFIGDDFKRKIIFRDVEHSYVLANKGFSKSAVILAGSVIEELLRLYLQHKGVRPTRNSFDQYLRACQENDLLKDAIHRLSDSVRHFRNFVHLEKEESKKHTISKATAKGAVASIFTVANDLD